MKEKDYKDYIKIIADFLNKRYEESINEKNHLSKNIYRKINVPMSTSCEDIVAIITSDILKNEKYCFLIDVLLPFKENARKEKHYRPDILIIDCEYDIPEIVGIIEVKAQMGYCEPFNPEEIEKKKNDLKDTFEIGFSKKEMDVIDKAKTLKKIFKKLKLNNCKIECKINKEKLKYLIVNVLKSSQSKKVKETINNFDEDSRPNIYFYTLFNKNGWYDNLNECNIFEYIDSKHHKNKYDFKSFLDDLQNFKDNDFK